ncbi:MAG: SRPBCC domain-containing protein, partial [Bacteroidetes bacterium]|nr:SRPBCC domain-containing protein [Bacteroidota bacterium]
METINLTTICKEITVEAAQRTAFEVFTSQMSLWWPPYNHNDGCPMVKVGLELKAGGRWYGQDSEGRDTELGKVLVYDPYALFALDWQIDNKLQFNPEVHTEVRIEFIEEGPKTTRVKLTHYDLQRLGEAAEGIDEGWGEIMDIYKKFVTDSFSSSMAISTSPTTIRKEVLVAASQETAFTVFTQNIDMGWPKTHHIGKCPMVEAVIEGRQGGRWYSRHEDGTEADNGYVLRWDPYGQLILVWQIDGDFRYVPDLVTEVEVNFIPEGPKSTRVILEHRDLQKLMGGSKVIESMDQGWGTIMNLYKAAV